MENRSSCGMFSLCADCSIFGINPNGVAKLVPPLASQDEEARGTFFAVHLNVKRVGGRSDNVTEMLIRPDIGIRQNNAFPNMKWMVLYCHKAGG